MRVFITEPKYPDPHSLLVRRLRNRWADLGPTVITNPKDFEVHGDLLSRIWTQIFRAQRSISLQEEDGIYVISESDFLIEPEFYHALKAWPFPGVKAIFTPYTTRDEHYNVIHHATSGPVPPGGPPATPGETAPDRLVGAWFMAFNFRQFEYPVRWPRLPWLGPDGPRNDAANMALVAARASGFLEDEQILWLAPCTMDPPPPFKGLEYMLHSGPLLYNVGTHCFFAREFMNPDPETLLLPHAPGVQPYLLKDHLAHIERLLHD